MAEFPVRCKAYWPCAPRLGHQDRFRRATLVALSAIPMTLLSGAGGAWAGAQQEEPLADAVRAALSAAVADGRPPTVQIDDIHARIAYLRWLGDMGDRLRSRQPDAQVRREFLETVWYESTRAGLEKSLVLGLIEVESAFRKYAVSKVGARGYMQVMPFWARLIGDGDASKLFHTQINLRFGCIILRHYLDRERGDVFMALGRYNGSRGRAEYPNAVTRARLKWEHRAQG